MLELTEWSFIHQLRIFQQHTVWEKRPYNKQTVPFPAGKMAAQMAIVFQKSQKETSSGILLYDQRTNWYY